MEVTAGIARKDQLESLGKCAAKRFAVATEGGRDFFGFEIPHLQRLVIRRRDRALPVPRHRHHSNYTCVAGELRTPTAHKYSVTATAVTSPVWPVRARIRVVPGG